jgi:L-arabinonolactonase
MNSISFGAVTERQVAGGEETAIVRVLTVADRLGEAVLWDERRNEALWTDIESARLWRWRWGADAAEAFAMPARLCAFALTERDGVYLGAFEMRLAWFTLDGRFAGVEDVPAAPTLRVNDGRADPHGGFLFGTMADVDDPPPIGGLWHWRPGGGLTCRRDHIRIPNGLAWSPDGATLYFADSATREVRAYDATDGGGGRLVHRFAPPEAPDGCCVDSEGRLWIAMFRGARVVCLSPGGELIASIGLPTLQPTCVALGGPDRDHLLVTSAADALVGDERGAADGALFVIRVAALGLSEYRVAVPPGELP